MARDRDRDHDIDIKGERGGDTGKTQPKGSVTNVEKGDQRRDTPVHGGPTRRGAQGTDSKHGKRSGSDSNPGRSAE
jgi:hypothetical protein